MLDLRHKLGPQLNHNYITKTVQAQFVLDFNLYLQQQLLRGYRLQLFKQIILNLKDTDEIIEIILKQPSNQHWHNLKFLFFFFFYNLKFLFVSASLGPTFHICSVSIEDHGCPHPVCRVCFQLLDSSRYSPDVSEFAQIESNNDEKYYKRYHRSDWVINLSGL